MRTRTWLFLLLIITLTACGPAAPSPITPTPDLTASSPAATATPSPAPALTLPSPTLSSTTLSFSPTSSATTADNPSADLIFTNGNLITIADLNPHARAIAIQGNKILAVGSDEEISRFQDDHTLVVDLAGRTLMPGFVDTHNHLAFEAHGNPETFKELQATAIRQGMTTSTQMGVKPDLLEQMKAFDQSGLMKMRWNTYLSYNTNCGDPDDPDWYKTYRQGEDLSAHIRNQGVKIFADGGSCKVPAVSFEYPGGYGQGDLYMTQSEMTAVIQDAQGSGHQVAMHALGDRAIEETQNAIAAALNGAPNTLRHRIEHNAVLHDTLLPRYNQIGIVPILFGSYPTCWRTNATSQFKYAVPVSLGGWEWPWRLLLDANPGLKAAWHSDFPVFPAINPLMDLYGFVTRAQVADDGGICQAPDWLKQGAITVDEALRIMTLNSAYALFREGEVGSLEAGKLADLIILSDDPEKVPPETLKDLHVLMTMIDGQMEYCAPGSEALCPTIPSAQTGTAPTVSAQVGSLTVTASAALPDQPAKNAVDGSLDTWWSAGLDAPQWIQIDLGASSTVSAIRLVVSQYPEGDTSHQIWVGADENQLTLVHTFDGFTKDLDALEFTPPAPLTGIRYMRIVTTLSPSWVSWREIEIRTP